MKSLGFLSSEIEAERKVYYDQLEKQQRATPDITDWLSWFLDCLGRAIANAEITLGIQGATLGCNYIVTQ